MYFPNSQSCVAMGTRPAGHLVPVIQPLVPQSESSENHPQALVPLKRRGPGDGGFLQLSKVIEVFQSFPYIYLFFGILSTNNTYICQYETSIRHPLLKRKKVHNTKNIYIYKWESLGLIVGR